MITYERLTQEGCVWHRSPKEPLYMAPCSSPYFSSGRIKPNTVYLTIGVVGITRKTSCDWWVIDLDVLDMNTGMVERLQLRRSPIGIAREDFTVYGISEVKMTAP